MTDDTEGACTLGQAEIARRIGLSRRSMSDATAELYDFGLIDVVNEKGREDRLMVCDPRTAVGKNVSHPGNHHGSHPSNHPGSDEVVYPVQSTTFEPTTLASVTSLTIPYRTDTDRTAAHRDLCLDLDRFAALYEFMTGDYALYDNSGRARQTIGGFLRISRDFDWVCDRCFSASELRTYLGTGLLIQQGEWLYISKAGERAYQNRIPNLTQAA